MNKAIAFQGTVDLKQSDSSCQISVNSLCVLLTSCWTRLDFTPSPLLCRILHTHSTGFIFHQFTSHVLYTHFKSPQPEFSTSVCETYKATVWIGTLGVVRSERNYYHTHTHQLHKASYLYQNIKPSSLWVLLTSFCKKIWDSTLQLVSFSSWLAYITKLLKNSNQMKKSYESVVFSDEKVSYIP